MIVATGIACTMAAFAQATPKGPAPMTIRFGDVSFLHRWSQNGQNEFTPASETDLSKWRDMVTINLFEKVTNGDQLADVANRIVGNYQTSGKIIRTDAKPRTKDHAAEYLIVAALGNSELMEAVFTRVVLHDGAGYAIVRSHRLYGKDVAAPMNAWLQKNGPTTESTLMAWNEFPTRDALKRLPQSK
jgi:hypothetical protein